MSERDPMADVEAAMRLVRAQPASVLVVGPELAAALRAQGCAVPDVAEVTCPFCGEAATDGSCLRAAADRIAELEAELADERKPNVQRGKEAEELRRAVEALLAEQWSPAGDLYELYEMETEVKGRLQRILDRVDARDSLAYLEAFGGKAGR